MALITCPECQKEHSEFADSCPHCGFVKKNKDGKKKEEKKSSGGCLKGIIITILGFILFIFIVGNCSDSGSSNKHDHGGEQGLLALSYAQDHMKKYLKNPSTAEWPGLFDKQYHIKPVNSIRFKINSWVDSKNALGATIRTKYSCVMVKNGSHWEVEDFVYY